MIDYIAPIKYVATNAKHVEISEVEINNYVNSFELPHIDHWFASCPFEYHSLPNPKDEITRRFIQDAQAFCFWGYPTKWSYSYKGQVLDGWWGFLAAFQNAIELGIPILDSKYLSKVTGNDLSNIFKGSPEIPLLKERTQIMNQIGDVLTHKYQGDFNIYLTSAPHDAWELVKDLADNFKTFDDTALYEGKVIPFYKKAQLLVDELLDLGCPVTNLQNLIGKADYKIPNILRKYGILHYSQELSNLVDNRVELESGSNYEVEIRACMLYANHLICKKLQSIGQNITPMQLDGILWVKSQVKDQKDQPYHLTKTTNY